MNMSHGGHASQQKVIGLVKEYNNEHKDNVVTIMIKEYNNEHKLFFAMSTSVCLIICSLLSWWRTSSLWNWSTTV
ncbi:hypothetical protein DCAR_0205913 [Daucus carota subsp. sativus]|uniref:Uncharacterized protein n=1 Tax=Daucus carota subsp. sativus TaxID=79200 RepID=A0AAF0WER4_DAUCS|nr:hypothetical protein DCAR_0205913 [Daucus carota subsp. sativus]